MCAASPLPGMAQVTAGSDRTNFRSNCDQLSQAMSAARRQSFEPLAQSRHRMLDPRYRGQGDCSHARARGKNCLEIRGASRLQRDGKRIRQCTEQRLLALLQRGRGGDDLVPGRVIDDSGSLRGAKRMWEPGVPRRRPTA